MNIDELCAEVNRVLDEQGVTVADGRTSSVVTPRNIRYYCSLGLVKPPVREGKRAKYERSHVNEVVSVKKAQVEGASLEQILKLLRTSRLSTGKTPEVSWMLNLARESRTLEPFGKVDFSVFRSQSSVVETPDMSWRSRSLGWSLRIGEMTLSGAGEPPTDQQIESIRKILDDDQSD